MERLKKDTENKNSGKERMKTLKGNYQKPEICEFLIDNCLDDKCSDMASGVNIGYVVVQNKTKILK